MENVLRSKREREREERERKLHYEIFSPLPHKNKITKINQRIFSYLYDF